jgi:hypothetical protein
MRFYRYIFWLLAMVHLGLGLWFCFAPQTVLGILDLEHSSETRQIFIQTQGLFYWMLCAGFAYAAESPEHAVPVVALMCLVKSLTPLFSWVGYNNHELSATYFSFELALDLVSLPLLISYFFWFFHRPRPNRFVHLIGLFGQKK